MPTSRKYYISPGRTILLSVIIAIVLGALLLMLPAAQAKYVSILDCFFTSTSSVCVTGVLTVDFDSFTLWGKIVILGLIQIGGIGLLTLTLFLASIFLNIGLSTQLMISQIFELENWRETKRTLFFIIIFTFLAELLGAILIYFAITSSGGCEQPLFQSIFHSISSFCSAGLGCFGNNMVQFKDNIPLLSITGLLILAGTIGFITWYELINLAINKIRHQRYNLSLTTKVVITVSTILIICMTLLLIVLEGPANFQNKPWYTIVINMLFNAVSYRSTGFTTVDVNLMQKATLFLIIMYSFIGSAPISTGSGVKVTTFALFLATIKSVIMGRSSVEIKGRKIPQDLIFKAMAILALSLCWIVISTFCLLLTERNNSFINIFFEAVSSFTTLGLATEMTPYLSQAGKFIIMLNMFIGRVGSLTLLLALKVKSDKTEFQYPEERLIIS